MWAALFPGQGSQAVGMGRFLFDEFAVAKQTFEEAGDTLKINFKKLCFDGPESDLQLTENTQPALLLVSTVTFRVIKQILDLPIGAAAGHSIGEYAAVVSSGALDFSDGLRAVRARGIAMQKAVPVGKGAMAAVMGMSEEQVIKLCAWATDQSGAALEPANFNAPGQIVISGSARALEWLKSNANADSLTELFKVATGTPPPRMKLIPLAVSAPVHCSLMKPAEDEMRLVLEATTFNDARFPIVQNVTAHETREASVLRENLIQQVSGAVRWTGCMSRLKDVASVDGRLLAIEFGAGKVLSGLAKKIDSSALPPFNINALEDIRALEKFVEDAV